MAAASQPSNASARSAQSSEQYFSDFPAALRYWRSKRGYSQLQLSHLGAVSQRHLSFLESGRSQPSREIILKLGQGFVLIQAVTVQVFAGLQWAGLAASVQAPQLTARQAGR